MNESNKTKFVSLISAVVAFVIVYLLVGAIFGDSTENSNNNSGESAQTSTAQQPEVIVSQRTVVLSSEEGKSPVETLQSYAEVTGSEDASGAGFIIESIEGLTADLGAGEYWLLTIDGVEIGSVKAKQVLSESGQELKWTIR